jgi:hypothetical protein
VHLKIALPVNQGIVILECFDVSTGSAMSEKWIQIKGDPSIRAFLFEQKRTPSLFDGAIEEVHRRAKVLTMLKGVFHIKIHYSSNQLTCWFTSDPYCYEKFVREEVLADGFLDRFAEVPQWPRPPIIDPIEFYLILSEFERLRLTDETIYLRNAAINLINGMINMSFSCDGTHYIDHKSFLSKLDNFVTPGSSS